MELMTPQYRSKKINSKKGLGLTIGIVITLSIAIASKYFKR